MDLAGSQPRTPETCFPAPSSGSLSSLCFAGASLAPSSKLTRYSILSPYPAYSSSLTSSSQVVVAFTLTAMCAPVLPGTAPCQ